MAKSNANKLQEGMLKLLENRCPIYLKDLTPEKQKEVLEFLGKFESETQHKLLVEMGKQELIEEGFAEFPIATIEKSYRV